MSAKYKSPSFLLPNELNTSANPLNTDGNAATGTGINSLYSMDFDGSSHINCGNDSSLTPTNSISISLWIKTNTTSQTQFSGPLDKHVSGTGGYQFFFPNSSSSEIKFALGNPKVSLTSTTQVGDTNWHHILATCDNVNCKLYIDGVLESTVSANLSTLSNSENLKIGGDGVSTFYFNGQIDEVAIFNRALNTTEIAALYEGTGSNIRPSNLIASNLNPIAYYPLGEQAQMQGYLGNEASSEWQFPNGVLQDYVMDFDGATIGDYIDVGDIPLEGVYTISFWINPDASPSSISFLLDKGDGSSNISVRVTQRNNNAIRFQIGSSYLESTDTLTNNSWNNVILIANGSSSKIYINNGTSPNGTLTTAPNTTQSLLIGTDEGRQSTYYFNGQMSNVVIWNSDQSTNIADIYNNGSPQTTYTVTPQNWWKLNADSVYTPSAPNYTKALDFGGSQSVDTNYTGLDGLSKATISLWVKPDVASANGTIFNARDGSAVGMNCQFFTSKTYLYFTGSINIISANYTPPFSDNLWANLVIVFDGTLTGNDRIKLYANGETKVIDTYNGTIPAVLPTSSTSLKIAESFNGQVSNFAIFNSALTSSQVSTLFNFGTPETNISFSPQAWWKLDDQTAITDSSNNGNTGTNNGATDISSGVAVTPSWKIPDASGTVNGVSTTLPSTALQQSDLQFDSPYSNYSLSFDGTGDYITVTQDFSSYTSMSVSGWVRTASTSQYQYLFSTGVYNGGTPGNGQGFGIGFDNTGKFAAWAGGANYFTFGSVSANTWYHVIQTITGTTLRFYVNGVLTSTQTVGSFNIPSSAIAVIGAYSGNSIPTQSNLYGKADELSIFNYELTTSQVLEIYNNGRPKDLTTFSGTAPTNWWRLGENAYFNTGTTPGPEFTVPNSISGAPNGTGSGTITTMISADAPGTYANGIGENLDILDRVGDAPLSTSNSQSYNMIPSDKSPYVPQYLGDQIANNSSMLFNGADEFFNTTGLSVAGYSAVSISAWVNFSSMNPAGRIIYENTNSAAYVRIALNITTANKLESELRLTSTGTNYTITGNTTLSTGINDWYNVVLVYDSGSTYKIYVNGSEDGTATAPTGSFISTASANSFRIGSGISQNYFDGKIDEVAIFDTALNAGQIYNDIYQPTASALGNNQTADLEKNPNLPNPVAWYRMGD